MCNSLSRSGKLSRKGILLSLELSKSVFLRSKASRIQVLGERTQRTALLRNIPLQVRLQGELRVVSRHAPLKKEFKSGLKHAAYVMPTDGDLSVDKVMPESLERVVQYWKTRRV
jgi:hypothetical protein